VFGKSVSILSGKIFGEMIAVPMYPEHTYETLAYKIYTINECQELL